MTSEELATLKIKIKALLHDPPEKALMLMQGESHEVRSREYIKALLGKDEDFKPEEVEKADQIASGADRYALYKQFAIRFLENPEVKHSLSGKPYSLGTISASILEPTKNNVLQAIQEIKDDYKDDIVKIYYALWRELQDRILSKEKGNEKLGALWSLLPADTRIPDHSIWEHRHVVSGLAGAFAAGKQGVSLFHFTLSPVQEFIAAARKTQDLWAGSYLLSYLSWQAMKVICEELGPDAIIFPDLYAQPIVDNWLKEEKNLTKVEVGDLLIPTLPNRFVAFVPSDQVESLAQKAIEEVQNEFLEIGKYAIGKLSGSLKGKCNEAYLNATAENQLKNFLELYWASIPLPAIKSKEFRKEFEKSFEGTLIWDDEKKNKILEAFEKSGYALNIGSGYGRLYALLEQVTGSRKALRQFAQVEEGGYRCSLIPRLAALTPKSNASPAEMREFWHQVAEASNNEIRANERLSAVSLAKRFFPEYLKKEAGLIKQDVRFPSTSEVAVARFKYEIVERALTDEELRKAAQNYANAVQQLIKGVAFRTQTLPKIQKSLKPEFQTFARIDGQYLFPESFDEEALKEEANADLEKRKEALQALHNLIQVAKKAGIAPPQKYYAILLLDGDNMGKWLSGENAPLFRDALHSKIIEEIAESNEDVWKECVHKNPQEYRRPQAPSQHIAISRALNNYALKIVRALVEEKYLGKLVYAGGDDVLALVTLDDALPLARDLRAAFSGNLAKEKWDVDWSNDSGFVQTPNKELLSTLGINASASVGIAVAHHLHPLQQALAAARQAEKFAKESLKRDAFGIQILKRSGEELQIGAKWRYGDVDTIEALSRFIEGVQTSLLSPKFAVDFQDEAMFLPIDAVTLELSRLYGRHTANDEKRKDEIEKLWDEIKKFVEAYLKKCEEQKEIDALSQLFSGMVFLAKGGRE